MKLKDLWYALDGNITILGYDSNREFKILWEERCYEGTPKSKTYPNDDILNSFVICITPSSLTSLKSHLVIKIDYQI